MAENTTAPQSSLYLPVPGYYSGTSPTYGVNSGDGTFFNQMINVPYPSELAKDLAEHGGKITKEMNEESKRSQRESAEVAKATLANRMYLSMQQAAISLSKEAIDVCKQA